jgi:hypothetical protein
MALYTRVNGKTVSIAVTESCLKMDPYIQAIGSTAINIPMASKSIRTVMCMKVTGPKIATMEPVLTSGVMGKNTQALGQMTRCMALENSKKAMERFIMVNSLTIIKKGLGNMSGQMEKYMMGNGWKTSFTGKVLILILKVK